MGKLIMVITLFPSKTTIMCNCATNTEGHQKRKFANSAAPRGIVAHQPGTLSLSQLGLIHKTAGDDTHGEQTRGRKSAAHSELSIPKNRSTGNLLAYNPRGPEKARIRFSFDAGSSGLPGIPVAAEYDSMSRLVTSFVVVTQAGTCPMYHVSDAWLGI